MPDAPARASLLDWIAVLTGMLGAFMAVLDIQITNASLETIEGAVGASASEGSWISTAYLMAEIITIPLTGWLGSVFGLRRYLIANFSLFLLFSVACAQSHTLGELIASRAGQGFSGGVLIPTAITILRLRLPRHQQPTAITIFGVCITLAPAAGPSIGGWLTENLSWHYIFYLNLLPGGLALAGLIGAMERAPSRLSELRQGDWLGIALMAVGLSSMTVVLEEGQQNDWFGSEMIRTLSVIAVIGVGCFVWRELVIERPLIKIALLGQRTIGGACGLAALFGAVTLGSTYIIPLYCAQIQGYSPEQIGNVVMWSGLPQLILYPAMPMIMRRTDPRLLIAIGTGLFATSCFINIHLSADVGATQLILPQLLRAMGQPLFSVPLSQLATAGLPPRDTADASALSTMMRNIGGSICIALISTVIERREHFHFSAIADGMTRNSLRMQAMLGRPAVAAAMPPRQALSGLASLVRQQATIMAYSDAFAIIMITLIVCMPAVLILRRPARAPV